MKKIYLTLFISFGLIFLFSGCSKDEIAKVLNTAPVAIAQTITVAQDTLDNNITLSASDVDDDTLIFSVETNTTNGVLEGTAPNLIYTPTTGYSGVDSFTFKVNDGLVDSNITTLSIVVNPPHNQLPIANAGVDQNITFGDDVTLDASSSTDDGTIVSYVWSQNSIELSTAISFVKSDFAVGVHTITLTVTDNQGATHTDSMVITAYPVVIANQTPIANAGIDQIIAFGNGVTLNASSSTDDGTIVSYVWSQNSIELSTAISLVKSDFAVGVHIITLTVTDNQGATHTDSIVIAVYPVVIANQTPIANAGVDQNIIFGDDVTLDASSSTDDGFILSYIWSENSTQLNSTVSFTKSDFTVGVHTITLTVTDNQGAAAIDEVTVSVNAPANLIPVSTDQNVTTDENVDLNITLSASDGDATDTLTYIIVANPTNGSLSSLTDNNITYTPTMDYNGTDSFTFKVNDGTVDSNIATVNITVNNVLEAILKTGQTIIYTNFDDGHYQAGATRSYSRDNTNNIVTDNTTGLVWQDDTTPASMTWIDALTYCTNLSLGGFTDWRLPAIKDLQTIVDDGKFNPTIDPTFQNTNSSANRYWSSTTYAVNTSSAWTVYFYASYMMAYSKTDSRHVRCVRLGQ